MSNLVITDEKLIEFIMEFHKLCLTDFHADLLACFNPYDPAIKSINEVYEQHMQFEFKMKEEFYEAIDNYE